MLFPRLAVANCCTGVEAGDKKMLRSTAKISELFVLARDSRVAAQRLYYIRFPQPFRFYSFFRAVEDTESSAEPCCGEPG